MNDDDEKKKKMMMSFDDEEKECLVLQRFIGKRNSEHYPSIRALLDIILYVVPFHTPIISFCNKAYLRNYKKKVHLDIPLGNL